MPPSLKPSLLRRPQLAPQCLNLLIQLSQPAPPLPSFSFLPVIQCRYKAIGSIPSSQQLRSPKEPSRPSIRTAQAFEIPRDIGLFPFTYIKPTGKKLPSLISNPRERWELYKRRWKYRIKTIQHLIFYKWFTRAPLNLSEPKKVALDLYKNMYTSYASGDLNALRGICNDGLYDTFRRRILLRPPKNKRTQIWKLHSVVGPNAIKVITNQGLVVEPLQNVAMRQAVVRIRSLQSLSKYDYKGDLIPGTGEVKEVTEYLVMQKRHKGAGLPINKPWWDLSTWKKAKNVKKQEIGNWIVWGTTEETTLAILQEREKNPMHTGGARI